MDISKLFALNAKMFGTKGPLFRSIPSFLATLGSVNVPGPPE